MDGNAGICVVVRRIVVVAILRQVVQRGDALLVVHRGAQAAKISIQGQVADRDLWALTIKP